MEGSPKLSFLSQTNDNFEKVYKPEKIVAGYRNSINCLFAFKKTYL